MAVKKPCSRNHGVIREVKLFLNQFWEIKMSVTVKVVWPQDSEPYEGAKVWISMGILGRLTNTLLTDRYGYVNFDDCPPGDGKINVNGEIVFAGEIPPTITLMAP